MPDIVQQRSWSYFRQRLGKQGTDAAQVLRDIIGVYSAHPSAPLSLAARVASFGEKDLYRLDQERIALRIPAMRLSVYMVPKETAHLVLAAVVPPASDSYWQKRYSGEGRAIPAEHYPEWTEKILRVAATPLTAAEIKQQLDLPEAIVKAVLNRIAFEGRLLRVGAPSLRSNIICYVATEAWLGTTFAPVAQEQALAWLAGEYLRSFGPARIKDFQWWAGVTATRAKAAITTLDTVDVGKGLLLPASDLPGFEKQKTLASDAVDLLPQWDSYTMGYAPDGRARFVSPDMQHHVYGKLGATGGNALGVVLVNGLAHGSWTSRFTGSRMNITLNMFEKPSATVQKMITAQFGELAALLQAKSLGFGAK